MYRRLLIFAFAVLTVLSAKAASIIRNEAPVDTSQWICFVADVDIPDDPTANEVRIATDSKYWLWVNGKLEVYEGGLKRGPNPRDTYADVVRLRNLYKGKNRIAVLVWYFGKQGFSHRSSDCPGFYMDIATGGKHYGTDASWRTILAPGFYKPTGGYPNFRLSESNVGVDAQKAIAFYKPGFDVSKWPFAQVVESNTSGWNKLVDREIPQWKDYGRKPYVSQRQEGNKFIGKLPYNCQMTPYLKVRASAGKVIDIRTDDYFGGLAPNVYAEYVTKDGVQEFECWGWMNGHEVIYTIPDGVEVLEIGYHETGYNCELNGYFKSDNPRLNSLWTKSQRTLYVTMRDNYMDCPDRERAQWIGDVTNELVQTFYGLSPESSLLTRKCLRELADWQRADSVMYAPVPEGNWKKELPMQTMAAIGLGAWNYYLGSGDLATIKYIYPAVKRYMHKWVIEPDGLVRYRKGAWDWGDWGDNQDMQAMCQFWYSITLENYAKQCVALGDVAEAKWARGINKTLKEAAHKAIFTGKAYRHPTYTGITDDRTQALAVIAGVNQPNEKELLRNLFKTELHASPYMERYVLEAMCNMGFYSEAIDRMLNRYKPMIDSPITTLWEQWSLEGATIANCSYNHAWSGGPMIILSRDIAGITPVTPGFKTFKVEPRLGALSSEQMNEFSVGVPTENGFIALKVKRTPSASGDTFSVELDVPQDMQAHVVLAKDLAGGKAKVNKKVKAGHYTWTWTNK